MAKKIYEEANIQAIADAIREKNGISASYKVAEMAEAILALDAGGSGSDAILPIKSNWEFSKVMEASDSYTMGDCRYTSGTFFWELLRDKHGCWTAFQNENRPDRR